jgi:hypothetical protein
MRLRLSRDCLGSANEFVLHSDVYYITMAPLRLSNARMHNRQSYNAIDQTVDEVGCSALPDDSHARERTMHTLSSLKF